MLHVGHQEAERRGHAREGRYQDSRNSEVLGDLAGVDRAGAAERDQGEVAQVKAALGRDRLDRLGHGDVDDPDDPLGGSLEIYAERVGDSVAMGQWLADVDASGRLLELVSKDGSTSVPASNVVRLRASHDLRGAARRVIAAGESRRPHDLIVVTDDLGRFVGLIDHETLVSEALAAPAGSVPPATDATDTTA